jgi:serine/threonine protein kinase
MGEVYEVVDRSAPAQGSIALKTLRSDRPANREAAARFEREVRNSLTVTHPNVCRMYGVGRHANGDSGIHYLTMEFLAGATLAKWLKDRDVRANPLTETEALPLIRQMAAGLAAIHANGVIHRDFKPANVMLAEHEGAYRAVITDFGLSHAIADDPDQSGTSAGLAIGTLDWMAPEQFGGEGPLTSAVDVYALGVTIHEMIAGVRYGHGAPMAELLDAPVSGRLRQVARRCLERDPAKRFPDAGAVVRALDPD